MKPPTLSYHSPEPAQRPSWVYLIMALYVALVLGLVAIWGVNVYQLRREAFGGTLLAMGIVFLLGGALLILVPIRARRGRPASRRSIWFPLLGSMLLVALLGLGAAIATIELFKADWDQRRRLALAIWGSAGVVWLFWTILFWWVSRSLDPVSFSAMLYKSVLAGSLLELAIAVPMHLVVRRRTECCAGMLTAAAICLGAVTAIVSLGPGVYFLYHRRWKEFYATRPKRKREKGKRGHHGSVENQLRPC
jgi:hypothetical protein